LRTTVTNKNFIYEEVKRILNSGSAYYHSIQNLLSSRLLSKNVKIRMYRTIILPAVLYGCGTWSLTLREEQAEDVREQDAEENIWTEEGRRDGSGEETA
jgi:hypothetical protein